MNTRSRLSLSLRCSPPSFVAMATHAAAVWLAGTPPLCRSRLPVAAHPQRRDSPDRLRCAPPVNSVRPIIAGRRTVAGITVSSASSSSSSSSSSAASVLLFRCRATSNEPVVTRDRGSRREYAWVPKQFLHLSSLSLYHSIALASESRLLV